MKGMSVVGSIQQYSKVSIRILYLWWIGKKFNFEFEFFSHLSRRIPFKFHIKFHSDSELIEKSWTSFQYVVTRGPYPISILRWITFSLYYANLTQDEKTHLFLPRIHRFFVHFVSIWKPRTDFWQISSIETAYWPSFTNQQWIFPKCALL